MKLISPSTLRTLLVAIDVARVAVGLPLLVGGCLALWAGDTIMPGPPRYVRVPRSWEAWRGQAERVVTTR